MVFLQHVLYLNKKKGFSRNDKKKKSLFQKSHNPLVSKRWEYDLLQYTAYVEILNALLCQCPLAETKSEMIEGFGTFLFKREKFWEFTSNLCMGNVYINVMQYLYLGEIYRVQ